MTGGSPRRQRIKDALARVGLGRLASRVMYAARFVARPQFRRGVLQSWHAYWEWRRHAATLSRPLHQGSTRRALIVTKGTINGARVEIALIKGLELAGFAPVVLTEGWLEKHYRLAGVRDFVRWERFAGDDVSAAADAIARKASCVEDVVDVEHRCARVGKFALSTTFRSLLVGRLDFALPETTSTLSRLLAEGMSRADAAWRLLDAVRPEVALFMGNRYTGQGELMDVCIERGIDVLTWFDAHRGSSLMLKRYGRENRDRHHGSISDRMWDDLRAMEWTADRRRELQAEYYDNYAAGDWYSRGGTQFNKSIVDVDTLRRRLDLDPRKKTAVIFTHIVWDATLFWGSDVFSNYEDWLVETVRAACANPRLNWIVKVHPAHVAKSAMEKWHGEPAEVVAIRERVGPLPPHVKVVPPDTDINTYSLFALMDYCLTVRGTIGIEAASLGIRVITAGSGRYDRRGFTVDSGSADEYLARLGSLEAVPPMTSNERELAERFAYGAFRVRPFFLTSLAIEHQRDVAATTVVSLKARSADELRSAPDLRAFAAWAADRSREDFGVVDVHALVH